MNLPLVSIIIPMYNQRLDYLRDCLKGALFQTYPNIEVIISDNHSTNGSSEILNEYSSNERLKIVKPITHLNIIDHFTFAASHASGEYISFLSSDDMLYPECISKVVKPLIENKDLSYSYCENVVIDSDGNQKSFVRNLQMPTRIYNKKEVARRIYNNSEYWIIGGVIRTEYYKKVGLQKNIIAGDWIMGLQLLRFGDVAYCNEALTAIRFHERTGEAKDLYAEQNILHYKQRIAKHNFIIEDSELLTEIGIQKKQAISYRDKEILNAVVNLTRQYHKGLFSKEKINEILELYKQTQTSFNFKFLTRFYNSKMGLLYTYVIGFYNRLFTK